MSRIYISHLRYDTSRNDVKQIRQRFATRFGADNILDTTSIQKTVTTERQEAVWSCNGLIVVLGRYALNMVDEEGNRVIDDPYDPVHVEIDAGLRAGMQIVVLLVDGVPKLGASQLPEQLQPLLTKATLYQVYDSDELEQRLDDLIRVRWDSVARIPKLKKPVSLTSGYEHLLADDPTESRYGAQNARNKTASLPSDLQRSQSRSHSSRRNISLIDGFDKLLADDPNKVRYGVKASQNRTPLVLSPSPSPPSPASTRHRPASNKNISLTDGFDNLLADDPNKVQYGSRQSRRSHTSLTSRHTNLSNKHISLTDGFDNLLADDPNKTPYREQSRKPDMTDNNLQRMMDKAMDWFLRS